jgi:hypothetical protein
MMNTVRLIGDHPRSFTWQITRESKCVQREKVMESQTDNSGNRPSPPSPTDKHKQAPHSAVIDLTDTCPSGPGFASAADLQKLGLGTDANCPRRTASGAQSRGKGGKKGRKQGKKKVLPTGPEGLPLPLPFGSPAAAWPRPVTPPDTLRPSLAATAAAAPGGPVATGAAVVPRPLAATAAAELPSRGGIQLLLPPEPPNCAAAERTPSPMPALSAPYKRAASALSCEYRTCGAAAAIRFELASTVCEACTNTTLQAAQLQTATCLNCLLCVLLSYRRPGSGGTSSLPTVAALEPLGSYSLGDIPGNRRVVLGISPTDNRPQWFDI